MQDRICFFCINCLNFNYYTQCVKGHELIKCKQGQRCTDCIQKNLMKYDEQYECKHFKGNKLT